MFNNDDDTSTVQISEANSLLGTCLLEADWKEALQHLSTHEGELDVTSKNDPLGLFNDGSSGGSQNIPQSKSSALFASLFVRAPFDVIAKIYEMCPSRLEWDDILYVLSIIPSEEVLRLDSTQRQIPFRSRAWCHKEYERIVSLLLQHTFDGPSYTSPSPSWILPSHAFSLHAVAMASYNPDISANTLQLLCAIEPKAMHTECILFGVQTSPLFVAAASPIPPKPSGSSSSPLISAKYYEAKLNRWEKVKALVIGPEWYSEQHLEMSKCTETNPPPLLPSPPAPTESQICNACEDAIKRHEWELVRELLKRQNEVNLPIAHSQWESDASRDRAAPVEVVQPSQAERTEPIYTALKEYDRKVQTKRQKQHKLRERNNWAHKHMGIVMYPLDVAVDLATAVIPSTWMRKIRGGDDDDDRGLVSPMS